MFNVNLTWVISWLLPTFMRGAALKSMLKSLVTPLQNVHNALDVFRIQKQYELSITSQVIWIEKMLNKIYDPIGEGITIEDVGYFDQVYLRNKAESPHPKYIYNKSEGEDAKILYNKNEAFYHYRFKVMVPDAIYDVSILDSIKANLNKYKMFGTQYQIIIV